MRTKKQSSLAVRLVIDALRERTASWRQRCRAGM